MPFKTIVSNLNQLAFPPYDKNLYHLYNGVNQYYDDCAFDQSIPEGEGTWPGDIEFFGYRQFKGKDRLKGPREY